MTRARPGDRPAPNRCATRSVVMGRRGMIATSQPLASAAGLRTLMSGGNAIDAAVAAAAVLAVVEPTMCGVGGDLFAIVYDAKTRKLRGLNASGRSGYGATPAAFAARHLDRIPDTGVLSVSVPGTVDGWAALLDAYGTLPLALVLEPALEYAARGFPVSEIISEQWKAAEAKLAADADAAATFLPGGRAPRPGDVFANPRLAATLETIAAGGADAFYRGPIADAIAADMRRRGGLLDARDLAEHRSDWIAPISTTYRGIEVHELPPNTQGFVALEMLNILEGFDLAKMGPFSADCLHLIVEAKRMAFADRAAYLADLDFVPPQVLKTLISKDYAAARRRDIALDSAAAAHGPGVELAGRDLGDTVYLACADGDGNVISLIQSLFADFGAGIVAGDTGIALQNRGSLFTLEPGHPNAIAPHKRPLHTLIPAMVTKHGRPWLAFGVMGGDHQAQGHAQVLVNLLDFGMNVQEAGEAARVTHGAAGLQIESACPDDVRQDLAKRGHAIVPGGGFGGYQGVMIDQENGVLMGGSDPRKDGLAIGY